MLKVAIIGCGKIADAHASQILRVAGCRIVGVCDREPLMAQQLADRFGVKNYFSDIEQLFDEVRPDVVHITTPPQTHFQIAKQALERGCHAYVEKPFTLDTREAEELIKFAQQKGLKLTVGHDLQYSHGTRRMRRLVRDGYLGGSPVHMESHYCYQFAQSAYGKALLADKQHWVRRLPGQLLQNVISHGVARIAEYFSGDFPEVTAEGFVSAELQKLGEREIIDELRVILRDESGATAYFTFSSQMRPALNQFRIYGPGAGLILDLDNETLVRLKGKKLKSYAEHFISPLMLAREYVSGASRNFRKFLGRDFHMKSGMKYLIEAFYQSITTNSPPPIPYREILLTSRIMDAIFEQIKTPAIEPRKLRAVREAEIV